MLKHYLHTFLLIRCRELTSDEWDLLKDLVKKHKGDVEAIAKELPDVTRYDVPSATDLPLPSTFHPSLPPFSLFCSWPSLRSVCCDIFSMTSDIPLHFLLISSRFSLSPLYRPPFLLFVSRGCTGIPWLRRYGCLERPDG